MKSVKIKANQSIFRPLDTFHENDDNYNNNHDNDATRTTTNSKIKTTKKLSFLWPGLSKKKQTKTSNHFILKYDCGVQISLNH